MASLTASQNVCMLVRSGGRVTQTCGCAWDRLFRARAELIADGSLPPEELEDAAMGYDGFCPSANLAIRAVHLAYDEPKCGHDFYDGCACPDVTDAQRRARVTELLDRA